MTDTVIESTPVDETLIKAREAERARFTREESLRRELEDTRKKLQTMKTTDDNQDVKQVIVELKKDLEEERARRSEVEELQAIVDFTNKNAEYELLRQLDESPKYVRYAMQEHYKTTGKHLSYADACQRVEDHLFNAEKDRFERFSKTKKAEKIYQMKSAETKESPTKVATKASEPTPQKTAPSEPKNFVRSNSREAFEFFKKQRNYGV